MDSTRRFLKTQAPPDRGERAKQRPACYRFAASCAPGCTLPLQYPLRQLYSKALATKTLRLTMSGNTRPQTASGIDWDNIPALDAFELMKTADPGEVKQVLARWTERWRQVGDQIDASVRSMGPEAFELGRWGWTVPIWGAMWLPRILARHSSEQDIDDYFLNEYSRRWRRTERLLLRELRKNNQLLHWRLVLDECIAAYRRGYFNLIIPALLSITEGVIAAATDQLNRPTTKLIHHARAKANESQAALIWVAWQSVMGFMTTTFARASFDAAPPSRLNRHWVLHGRHVRSASKADCLRLFQAIHTTAYLWKWATEQTRNTE